MTPLLIAFFVTALLAVLAATDSKARFVLVVASVAYAAAAPALSSWITAHGEKDSSPVFTRISEVADVR